MQVKHCSLCGLAKPPEEFYRDRSTSDGLRSRCRDCCKEVSRLRYAANPEAEQEARRRRRKANPETYKEAARRRYAARQEAAREAKRRLHASNRDVVLDRYGRKCACCGSTARLTVDHVNGDGREHRAEIGRGSHRLYRWLVANGFPDGFQVLCFPCNKSKDIGASCQLDHSKVAA